MLYILLGLSALILILISVCRPLSGRKGTRDVETMENAENVESVELVGGGEPREVFVISPSSECAEVRMVEALVEAGCSRVTYLGDPITQELMAIAGPEHFITDLIHNPEVKIVLLEEKDEEEEGTLVADRSCITMR